MYKKLLPDHCLLPGALGPVKQTVEVSYWMTSSADAGTTLLVGRYSYWRSSTISSAQNRGREPKLLRRGRCPGCAIILLCACQTDILPSQRDDVEFLKDHIIPHAMLVLICVGLHYC